MGAPVDGVFDHSGVNSKYSNDSIHTGNPVLDADPNHMERSLGVVPRD